MRSDASRRSAMIAFGCAVAMEAVWMVALVWMAVRA